MATTIRIQQLNRLLQATLGEIFIQEGPRLFGRIMITVTNVQMVRNLSLAKVYLSFMLTENKKTTLKAIIEKKKELRGLLGRKLAHKLRRIPDIQFYIDNSTENAIYLGRLMDNLSEPVDKEDTLLVT
jgi:ribosome-binding factor A